MQAVSYLFKQDVCFCFWARGAHQQMDHHMTMGGVEGGRAYIIYIYMYIYIHVPLYMYNIHVYMCIYVCNYMNMFCMCISVYVS